MTTRRDPLRSTLMLAMALVAIALAFRLVCDGIAAVTNPDPAPQTVIPTIVVPDTHDDRIVPKMKWPLRFEGI